MHLGFRLNFFSAGPREAVPEEKYSGIHGGIKAREIHLWSR
jgi:hypothetical protein